MSMETTAPKGSEDRRSLLSGLGLRILSTLLLLVGGAVFIILYLGFLATHYPWYQNLAVVLAAFLIVPAVLAAMWVSWGIAVGRRAHRWTRDWSHDGPP